MPGTYAFIDGNYLHSQYERQMQAFYGQTPPILYEAVGSLLAADRFFFYDAIDYQKSETETETQREERIAKREALHDHITSRPGFHVRDGYVRRSQKRKREQKGVDVQLAVDAMEHAARGNLTRAVLF